MLGGVVGGVVVAGGGAEADWTLASGRNEQFLLLPPDGARAASLSLSGAVRAIQKTRWISPTLPARSAVAGAYHG